jgi:protein-disulfide isomerase
LREAKHKELQAAARRKRLQTFAALAAVVVVALVAFIAVSSLGGGGSALKANVGTHAADVSRVKSLLDGIPESGNTLGYPIAPVTVTEYGDLVCPICYEFSQTSEPQFIAEDVRTGKVRLTFRGFETASATANAGEYVATQVAARAAGLQGRAWYYIMLMYDEQPQTINGADAETIPYITTAYLQKIAEQVPGLNLLKWQKDLSDPALIAEVKADEAAAKSAGVTGTPTVFATGSKGTQEGPEGVPTLAQLQTLVGLVS